MKPSIFVLTCEHVAIFASADTNVLKIRAQLVWNLMRLTAPHQSDVLQLYWRNDGQASVGAAHWSGVGSSFKPMSLQFRIVEVEIL